MATTILTVGALFQTRTSGNWPFARMSTGKWHLVWTPTAASTDAAWGNSGAFYGFIVANDLGGIWIVNDAIEIYDQSQALLAQIALTWSAGAAIDLTFDMAAGTVTIAGATTGNGVHNFAPSTTVFTNVTLGLGIYGGGGFNLPTSTFSDIDDAENGSTGTLSQTLGALTAASAGTVAVQGAAAPTLGALAVSSAGTVESAGITGSLTATLGALTTNGAGSVAVSGSAAPTLGALTTSSAGSVEVRGSATIGLGALTVAAANQQFDVGAATAEQELYAVSHGGAFTKTTPGTDVEISSVNASTNTLTSAAHGMKTGDGPFRLISTGTLPDGLSAGTDYYVIAASGTTFRLAATGAAAIAGTAVDIVDDGSGTHTLVRTVDTQSSGSVFLAALTRGDWDAAPSAAPTDNKGNSYSLIGATHAYASYPGSKTGLYFASGAGGADHTWSLQGADFDEVTIAAVEVKGDAFVQAHSHVERTGSATITSDSVTTTGPSLLVAVCFGSGPVGQDHTFTPEVGWTKLAAASREADMSDNGYIQVSVAHRYVATPGTYDITWTGTDDEGGQLYLVALQEPPTVLGALAATLGALTSASSGTVAVSGACAVTLGALTTVAAGTLSITGAASVGLGALVCASAGSVRATGALAATLGALTASAAGSVAVSGSVAAGLGALTVSATGDVGAGNHGLASITLGALVATASGVVGIRGELAQGLGPISCAATGSVVVQGQLVATLGALTCVASDAVVPADVSSATIAWSLRPAAQLAIVVRPATETELITRPATQITIRVLTMSLHIGDAAEIAAVFRRSSDRVLIDPTVVTIDVQAPSQVATSDVTTYTYGSDDEVTRTSLGNFVASIPLTEAGTWRFAWKCPGPVGKAAEPGYFDVAATI